MIQFELFKPLAERYRFVPTVPVEQVLSEIKSKYEYIQPIIEMFREKLEGEWVDKSTIKFSSSIELSTIFSLVDQKMVDVFGKPYNKFVRGEIHSVEEFGRTCMTTLWKMSFVSKRYDFDKIMENDSLRMYPSSLFHWAHYNEEYELADKWYDIFAKKNHPNPANAPKTTKLLKKVVNMFEGRPEKSALEGRFTDTLTASASGRVDSESVYITFDFTQLLQCSHNTAVTWGSCYALDKQYPYSSFYMASHPNIAMIFTVNSNGLKTFRSWLYVHPDGFAINKEAWPNNNDATNVKRNALYSQIASALEEDAPLIRNESFTSSGNNNNLGTHEIYRQFTAGGHRANMIAYRDTGDFYRSLDSFYRNHSYHSFRGNGMTRSSMGSVRDRTPLTRDELALMDRIQQALVQYRETGEFGPSELVVMLRSLSPEQIAFFKQGLIAQHGEDIINAALLEAFPPTIVAVDEAPNASQATARVVRMRTSPTPEGNIYEDVTADEQVGVVTLTPTPEPITPEVLPSAFSLEVGLDFRVETALDVPLMQQVEDSLGTYAFGNDGTLDITDATTTGYVDVETASLSVDADTTATIRYYNGNAWHAQTVGHTFDELFIDEAVALEDQFLEEDVNHDEEDTE